MEAYVLVIRLMVNGPVVAMPVNDCYAGVVWIREARAWAERSGVPETGPMYVCFPVDHPGIWRVTR